MIQELSFLVYGGQPRKVLHRSTDVVDAECQSMMKWCGSLAEFGEYDKFISSGGLSWIDVPTSTGRRLFLRVFATSGEARDCWYFLGILLSKQDYLAIKDYGSIVSFVESFCLEKLREARPVGSKLKAEFDVVDVFGHSMPPFFSEEISSDWKNSTWIQDGAIWSEHVDGNQICIAVNPPSVQREYTSLLLKDGFPKPGMRLERKLDGDIEGAQAKKKVPKGWLRFSHMILLIPFLAVGLVGYIAGSTKSKMKFSQEICIVVNGQVVTIPTIRLPRRPSTTIEISVKGNKSVPSNISARPSVSWIAVGSAIQKGDGEVVLPCRVLVPKEAAINEELFAYVEVTQGTESIGVYHFELESAGVIASIQPRVLRNETPSNGRSLLIGIATARYGLKTVEVDGLPVEVELSAEGTLGTWTVALSPGREKVTVVVGDINGNQLVVTEELLRLP